MVGIIGTGPAGLFSVVSLRHLSDEPVIVFERNEQIGKKLLISGGGRCNLTNALPKEQFLERFREWKNFFKPAFFEFSNEDVISFFEKNELKLKEEGKRIFPKSGKASSVISFFKKYLSSLDDIHLYLGCKVYDVKKLGNKFLIKTQRGDFQVEKLLIATGSVSYGNKCGTFGDGLRWAREFGHTVTELVPHLCELWIGNLPKDVAGIVVKDVVLSVEYFGRLIEERGDIIFTHKGISGPAVHNISRFVLAQDVGTTINIDFFPELSADLLMQRLGLLFFSNRGRKKVVNLLREYLPRRLIVSLLSYIGVENKTTSNIRKEDVRKMVALLKSYPLEVVGGPPVEWAFVVAGGVPISEVNCKTMESKIVDNLYFAGEILEPVGPTGGYNIQFAISTGWLAGKSMSKT